MSSEYDKYFPQEKRKLIEQAIAEAEKSTSGEIRLFIENKCKDPLSRAAFVFDQLKMHETQQRNGVLFYLAIKSHHFAILGDHGINSKVPDDFWENIKGEMQNHFRNYQLSEGLITGIKMAGHALQQYFPYASADKNELPDEVIFHRHGEDGGHGK